MSPAGAQSAYAGPRRLFRHSVCADVTRRRLIGPRGRRLPEPCAARTREAGTSRYKVPEMERTRICRYTVPREEERAFLVGGGAPPTFRGRSLIHRGPHLYFSRSRQKLQVGKIKNVFQSGKSPNRRLSVTGSPSPRQRHSARGSPQTSLSMEPSM